MIRRNHAPVRAGELEKTGIIRGDDLLGPYPLPDAKALLALGTLLPNDLVKLGIQGKPFPAAVLADAEDSSRG